MSDKDGGPAFYMTLRDHFAMAALQGQLSAQKRLDEITAEYAPRFALSCYQMADAMLAAREAK